MTTGGTGGPPLCYVTLGLVLGSLDLPAWTQSDGELGSESNS